MGEWQNVALSRSFIRDSQVMVLDEPTSSMDAIAEEQIFNNFRLMAAGTTALAKSSIKRTCSAKQEASSMLDDVQQHR